MLANWQKKEFRNKLALTLILFLSKKFKPSCNLLSMTCVRANKMILHHQSSLQHLAFLSQG
jgi:hypothetical protein